MNRHLHTDKDYAEHVRVVVSSSIRAYEVYRAKSENAVQRSYYQGMVDGLRQCQEYILELSRDNVSLCKALDAAGVRHE